MKNEDEFEDEDKDGDEEKKKKRRMRVREEGKCERKECGCSNEVGRGRRVRGIE